jgi:hypothetical protein
LVAVYTTEIIDLNPIPLPPTLFEIWIAIALVPEYKSFWACLSGVSHHRNCFPSKFPIGPLFYKFFHLQITTHPSPLRTEVYIGHHNVKIKMMTILEA